MARFGRVLLVLSFALAFSPALARASWTIQNVPTPPIPDGTLAAVSCPSTSDCTAVGSRNGAQAPYAEHWNGTGWSSQTMPTGLPTDTGLQGVSCAGGICMAVGQANGSAAPFALEWNGSSWQVQTLPAPPNALSSYLVGVSCAADTATVCTAIGHYQDTSYANHIFAERWASGSWSYQAVKQPNTQDSLSGVSCPTSSYCLAVGSFVNSSSVLSALAEVWTSAGGWAVSPAKNPGGSRGTEFTAASCTAVGACTAVGSYAGLSLAEQLTSGGWSTLRTYNPSSDQQLEGVSCSGSRCTAVGWASGSSGRVSYAEYWDGTTLGFNKTAQPAGSTDTTLTGVSCPGTACVAAGHYVDSSGYYHTLVQTWTGSTSANWARQKDAQPMRGEGGALHAVSCASSASCVAIGGSGLGSYSASWNASTGKWTSMKFPSPSSGLDLTSISCQASNWCMAVGSDGSTAPGKPVVEFWNGSSWSVQSTDSTVPSTGLSSVSCVSTNDCMAIGSQPGQGLAEHYDGNGWTATALPSTPASALASVSCTKASGALTNCQAVGWCQTSTGWREPMEDAWNGTTWAMENSTCANSSGGNASLGLVGCASASWCVAFGSDDVGGITSWVYGGTWTLQGAGGGTYVNGVSCPSASTNVCLIVGDSPPTSTGGASLFAGTDPSGSALLPKNPWSDSAFYGVSCTAIWTCTAVGVGDGNPVAERFTG
jgi:hypothetical protein